MKGPTPSFMLGRYPSYSFTSVSRCVVLVGALHTFLHADVVVFRPNTFLARQCFYIPELWQVASHTFWAVPERSIIWARFRCGGYRCYRRSFYGWSCLCGHWSCSYLNALVFREVKLISRRTCQALLLGCVIILVQRTRFASLSVIVPKSRQVAGNTFAWRLIPVRGHIGTRLRSRDQSCYCCRYCVDGIHWCCINRWKPVYCHSSRIYWDLGWAWNECVRRRLDRNRINRSRKYRLLALDGNRFYLSGWNDILRLYLRRDRQRVDWAWLYLSIWLGDWQNGSWIHIHFFQLADVVFLVESVSRFTTHTGS